MQRQGRHLKKNKECVEVNKGARKPRVPDSVGHLEGCNGTNGRLPFFGPEFGLVSRSLKLASQP